MQITVVIATHNRPVLLRDAIASIEAQSFREWEVVVVDDGSQPPVELESVSEMDVERIRLLRHDVPHGPSGARNTGMRAATGDLVTFLDDDDLFKPDALKRIDSAFQNDASLDCLFFNVELFGSRAEGTRHNQDQALSQLFYKMDLPLPANDDSIVQLDSEALFIALLDHLPMAFQRVVIKRNMLEKVGLYTGRGFEDLEWYYRVVLHCQCAFQAEPLYLVRCEGQSYFSRIEAKKRLMDTIICIRESLLSLDEVSAKSKLHRLVGASLAKANFNKAYFAHESGLSFPWRNFFDSCEKGLYWRHFSLVGKVLISRIRQVLSPFR